MTTKEMTRDEIRTKEVADTSAKVVETCSVNDAWRQGDVEIRYLGLDCNLSRNQTAVPVQLAPGTTKGSRHNLVFDKEISAFVLSGTKPLEGPLLLCPNGLTVEHPEHGDVTIREPGYYAITYQRAFAEELRRQAD